MKLYEEWGIELIKRIKNSLAVKVFFITAFLLTFACAITFFCISKILPVTYTTILNNDLDIHVADLTSKMESVLEIQDGYSFVEEFEKEVNGSVLISEIDGTILYPSSDTVSNDDILMAFVIDEGNITSEAMEEVEVKSAGIEFQIANGKEYQLSVLGDMTRVNEATTALMKSLPYIIIVILILSFLCASFYSWYITRPVIKLCHISKQMAFLDFEHKYRGERQDEIGLLGNNLNELSDNLSKALSELSKANEELKNDMEKERYLEEQRMEFFSAVSHELKTPITILKGHVNGMLDGIGNYKNHEHYLKRVLTTAEQMERLVSELLTISRMESMFCTSCIKKIDIAELIRERLADMTDLILANKIDMEINVPEHLFCPMDKGLIDKVLGNIFTNAVRYTPFGGKLRVTLYEEDDWVYCQVENTDSHIPEEALEHVFEPFYRVEQSRNRYTGGSGLGLYIVRNILEKHSAVYEIKNTLDGVLFEFSLPSTSK